MRGFIGKVDNFIFDWGVIMGFYVFDMIVVYCRVC